MRRALGVRSSAQPASVQRSHALAACVASCAAPCGCGLLRGAVAEPVLVFVSGAVVFAGVPAGHGGGARGAAVPGPQIEKPLPKYLKKKYSIQNILVQVYITISLSIIHHYKFV
jgi:hypothetical protein